MIVQFYPKKAVVRRKKKSCLKHVKTAGGFSLVFLSGSEVLFFCLSTIGLTTINTNYLARVGGSVFLLNYVYG